MKSLGHGLYLFTQEGMVDDQTGWDDQDPYKDYDFSAHAFWLCTDCGAYPIGFDTKDALIQFIEES